MDDQALTQRVIDFVRRHGQVRAHELQKAGLPTALLYRLRDRGELIQLGPGLFQHSDATVTEKHTYAEAAKLVPRGVVCLISALAFHEIGTQMPRKVWLAIDRSNRRRPEASDLPLEFVWFSGPAFAEGQEEHVVEGATVKVYNPGKTVADLFKYRRKLGVDVAIEALREVWRARLATLNEIQHYATICGVKMVMKPYLQSLTAGT